MPEIVQNKAEKGSQKWLQVLANQHQEILDDLLRPHLQLSMNDTFTWLSPLKKDNHVEYQDEAFLKALSIQLSKKSLDSFWPARGPVWDGLGKTSRGDIILIEAKSHTGEPKSTCGATEPSRSQIKTSLEATAKYFGVDFNNNWLEEYYQYANRLAHLYLLRELNKLDAWLVFIYFVNDKEMHGGASKNKWEQEIKNIHSCLGIDRERLKPYVVDLFIDVGELA